MTLLDLAKRCSATIQEVAKMIQSEFDDNLPVSTSTHVPDKYVGHIISLYIPKDPEAEQSPKKKSKKKSPAQTFGDGQGSLYKLSELAKDLNVGIQTIVERYNHIFIGNINPNSRVSENLAHAIMTYFGKDYLINPSRIEKQSKAKASKKDTRETRAKSKESSQNQYTEQEAPSLRGSNGIELLKYLRESIDKRLLTGKVINYEEKRDVYFVEVLGLKALMYGNEVNPDVWLNSNDKIEIIPVKVQGYDKVEYMTVSMKRAEAFLHKKQPHVSKQPRVSKQQLANEFEQIKIGQIVDAKVSRIEDYYILVEFGHLRGIISKGNLFWSDVKRINHYWNIGAPIQAKVISKEIVDGNFNIRLSHKACIPNVWEELDLEVNENGFHETEEASVVEVNDDGVVISIAYDLEGILPLSEISYEEYQYFRTEDLSKELVAVFIKNYDAKNKRLIFTRQPYYDEQWESVDKRFVSGNVYSAEIIGKTDYKIWVKLDEDIESCIEKADLAWENTNKSNDSFRIGDTINVLVKSIDVEKHKINASIKELTPDPWILADENIKGQDIEVKVIGIREEKSIRVETLDNLHLIGTIRLSEISWQYSSLELPKSMIPGIGEIIKARVIVFDKDLRRLSLSIRQLIPDPWSNLQCGAYVRGKLGSMTSNDEVEVVLENGLIATTNEIELLSLDDEYIDFKVSDYSRQTNSVRVSHSQLQYDRVNESVIMSFFGNSQKG